MTQWKAHHVLMSHPKGQRNHVAVMTHESSQGTMEPHGPITQGMELQQVIIDAAGSERRFKVLLLYQDGDPEKDTCYMVILKLICLYSF